MSQLFPWMLSGLIGSLSGFRIGGSDMFSHGRFFLIAVSVSLLSTTSIASAACTGVKCRCAVANGGTYDAATDRWSIHGCAPSQMIAFYDCVARGRNNNVSSAVNANTYKRISGAIGEQHLERHVRELGHEIIQGRHDSNANGPDLVSRDPKTGEIVYWDAKYKIHGRGYPKEVDAEKLKRWSRDLSPGQKFRGEIFRDRQSLN